MSKLTIENVDRTVTLRYKMVPENARSRLVLRDTSGNYYKVTQVLVNHTTASGATAVFYGIRINRETGAHIDPAPVHFLPDHNQVKGVKEEVESLIKAWWKQHR